LQPKVDLSRVVKWPRYIRLQRQRKILVQRLKVPPSINQFSKTLDKNQATELLKVLMKYQPEDKKAKQQRLKEIAAAKEAGMDPAPSKAPKVCKPLMRYDLSPSTIVFFSGCSTRTMSQLS
ncbi:unnamed protein product, partial [Laminaria digitata]